MKKLALAFSLALLPAFAQADDQSVAIAQLTAKITQLEEQNRQLNGQIQDLQHQVGQVQSQAAAAQTQAQEAASATQQLVISHPAQTAPTAVPANTQTPAQPATTASGETISKPNAYVTKISPNQPAATQTAPADDNAEQQFDEIFKLIAAEDYKNATPKLKTFIDKHPSTELSGEAYFWLGEIAWTQRDFNTAAVDYLKGYKEAPTGEKAPDNLLKMALTLKELGKKPEACKNIERFNTEFPDAHKDLQSKAASAATEMGCK